MARGTLEFGTRLRGAAEARSAMGEAPDKITRAMRTATKDVTQLLGHHVDAAIARIAGGVYWDVRREYADTGSGGRGRVVTGPNRPHKIRPKPSNPRGVLSFVVAGRWVSVKEVNHPGANPVEWTSSVEGFGSIAETFYASEVGQAINGMGSSGGRFGA